MTDAAQPLRDLVPQHEFFIGIDSDGCAFDTMELKHKECFAPNTIKHWSLQPAGLEEAFIYLMAGARDNFSAATPARRPS